LVRFLKSQGKGIRNLDSKARNRIFGGVARKRVHLNRVVILWGIKKWRSKIP